MNRGYRKGMKEGEYIHDDVRRRLAGSMVKVSCARDRERFVLPAKGQLKQH